MADSAFWRGMESQFRRLDPDRKLRAQLVVNDKHEPTWEISGLDDRAILDRFRELAAYAGDKASEYAAQRDPVAFWLDLLNVEIGRELAPLLQKAKAEDTATSQTANALAKLGIIEQVSEISARFCGSVLAVSANEAEQRILAETASKGDWRTRTQRYRESGAGTPAFWSNLKSHFLALPNRQDIYALTSSPYGEHWSVGRRGNLDAIEWERLEDSFSDLATRGAVMLAFPGEENRLHAWLDCLRAESPLFLPFDTPGSGRLEQLVNASSDYCSKLETRALERQLAADIATADGDLATRSLHTGSVEVPLATPASAMPGKSVSPPEAVPKKRGRPTKIPDTRKAEALKCKADGGSNRDAAKILYGQKYPDPKQTKNVPAILRHYKNTVNASAKPVKPIRKPNKTAG